MIFSIVGLVKKSLQPQMLKLETYTYDLPGMYEDGDNLIYRFKDNDVSDETGPWHD